MKITLNGELKEFDSKITVTDLLKKYDIIPAEIVVEKNGDIIPNKDFNSEVINEGDVIELIRFMGGG